MDRKVVDFRDANFVTYSLQGKPQDDFSWHNNCWSDADDPVWQNVPSLSSGNPGKVVLI
jgi:hypothetical protein